MSNSTQKKKKKKKKYSCLKTGKWKQSCNMLLEDLLSIYAGTLLIPWNSGMKPGTVNKNNPIPSYPYIAGLVSKMGDLC